MVINPTEAKAELSKLIFRHIPDEPLGIEIGVQSPNKYAFPMKTDRRIFTPAADAGVNLGVFIAFFPCFIGWDCLVVILSRLFMEYAPWWPCCRRRFWDSRHHWHHQDRTPTWWFRRSRYLEGPYSRRLRGYRSP